MYSSHLILTFLLAILATVYANSITVRNHSPSLICYKVELSQGSLPTNTTCDSSDGFTVASNQSVILNASTYFNGAITAMIMGTNGINGTYGINSTNGTTKGTRHEINFFGPQITWYDVDFELGMSNSTLGPADNRTQIDGRPSLAGESNCLAKANAVWNQTFNKEELILNSTYLRQDESGNLTHIHMDKDAPFPIIEFFQLTANFSGYIGPGSIDGIHVDADSRLAKVVKSEDRKSFKVDTQDMVITAY